MDDDREDVNNDHDDSDEEEEEAMKAIMTVMVTRTLITTVMIVMTVTRPIGTGVQSMFLPTSRFASTGSALGLGSSLMDVTFKKLGYELCFLGV